MSVTTYQVLQLLITLCSALLAMVGAYFGARMALLEVLNVLSYLDDQEDEGGEDDVENSG